MEDVRVPQKSDEAPAAAKSKKKNRTVTFRINRNVLFVGIAVIFVIGVYFLGVHQGQKKAKPSTQSPASLDRANAAATSNRWTSVGTVQEVSDSSIKVKDSRDEVKQAAITKDTKIVNRKGEQLKASDIKKDQRVIISGTKDEKDKNKLTATRIRLQQ